MSKLTVKQPLPPATSPARQHSTNNSQHESHANNNLSFTSRFTRTLSASPGHRTRSISGSSKQEDSTSQNQNGTSRTGLTKQRSSLCGWRPGLGLMRKTSLQHPPSPAGCETNPRSQQQSNCTVPQERSLVSSTGMEPPPSYTDINNEDNDSSPSLREAFDFFDRDHDGRITCAELHSVFHMLGRTATRQEIKLMISQVDADCNGTVEYPEFLRMMRNYSYQHTNCEEAELLDAFSVFDHNGDNYIDFEEIKSTMHALGENVSDADVRAMIKEADSDHDGKINFDEFKRMMALLRADRPPVHRD